MFIYPYKDASVSAGNLANLLMCRRIKRENSKFRGNPKKFVINWGNSTLPEEVLKCKVINKPEAVAVCSNKLSFFNKIKSHNDNCLLNNDGKSRNDLVSIPPFSNDEGLENLLIRHNGPIVCRTVLNGHSGEGIVISEVIEDLVPAPLYVGYIKKKSEYRVHVLDGVVVDVQKKARDTKTPDDQVNWKVRNHRNGFVYVRNYGGLEVPDDVLTNALNAVKVVGLDFGAVDIIWNEKQQKAYVLEINTAPGLQGETLQGYADRFNAMADKFNRIDDDKKEHN